MSSTNNQNRLNSRAFKPNGDAELIEERKEEDKGIEASGHVKLNAVDLRKYTYLKPTYRALVEEFLPRENSDGEVPYIPPFPIWLQVVVRAIFDSKTIEMLLSYNKGKRITRFPEFVFSWLGTYCIDKDSRKVKTLEYTEKDTIAGLNRSNLLLGLESATSAKLWEVTIFREFLEEVLGLDELVYFLHCRLLLFRGLQLSIPTAGFCVTHFVTKEKVNDLIDRIMYGFSEDERKNLKKKLVDFSAQSYKDVNACDSGMILRVLIEFYRKEKKKNFIRFERLFTAAKNNLKSEKLLFPFSDFYKVIAGDFDKNISDLNISTIYRNSYIAGGSSITCDSVLLAFTESTFWINYLRLKGQNLEPKYDTRGDIDQSNDIGKECGEVYE